MAIACMLPIPAAGIMPQSVPTVATDSVIDAEGDAAAWWEAAGAAVVVLPQAAAVTASAQAITGIAVARRPRARPVSVDGIASPGSRELADWLLAGAAGLACPVTVTLG